MSAIFNQCVIQSNSYLDLGLDIFDSVTGLHLKGDGLPCQGLHEDLHGRNLDLLKKGNLLFPTIIKIRQNIAGCMGQNHSEY